MLKKSYTKGCVILFLVTLVLLAGCAMGSGPVDLDFDTASSNDDTGSGDGVTPEERAAILVSILGRENVSRTGAVVTLIDNIEVKPNSAREAIFEDTFPIGKGVTLSVPSGKTFTMAKGVTATVSSEATLEVKTDGTVVVEDGAKIEVSGGKLTAADKSTVTVKASGGLAVTAGSVAIAAGAVVDTGNITTTGAGKITDTAGTQLTGPVLKEKAVSYPTPGYNVTVMFTFDKAVTNPTATSDIAADWTFTPSDKTVTAAYKGSANGPVTAKFTVAEGNFVYAATALAVTTTMPTTGEHTIAYYEKISLTDFIVGLKNQGNLSYYYLTSGNPYHTLFNAICTPNAPDAPDTIEDGKSTVVYTKALSDAVLGLFTINFSPTPYGSSNYGDYIVQIKGTSLPAAATAGASKTNLIVIDVGIPDETNSGKFYIPFQDLGDLSENYSHIRLRVNKGAELVIEANNSRYVNNGAGNPCGAGYFNGGCVEVMAGGKLRDAAFEGFPLGTGAVILNRNGSYLSVGPEPDSADAIAKTDGYTAYYAGYLLGPSDDPRITWDNTKNADSYLEVSNGAIATNAQLTVKKFLGLIYSVWFVDSASLTISSTGGLYANESAGKDYNFYGTSQTRITIESGGTLDGRFLKSGASDTPVPLFPSSSSEMNIEGTDEGEEVFYVNDSTGISGRLIPPPSL
jgi:hypothetical protein